MTHTFEPLYNDDIEDLDETDTMIYQFMVCFMVFNATFNNISAISWQSALLMEESKVPTENHRPVASH